MNATQGTKPYRLQYNQLLDAVVKIIKYKESTIDHVIYIKFFYNGTVSYLIVFTNGILNATNNETEFPELIRFFKEAFDIKAQEGHLLKYLNLRIF